MAKMLDTVRSARREAGLRPQPGRVNPFAVPVGETRTPIDREMFPHFWYPGRLGVELAPQWFLDRLLAIHPGLSCTKYPLDGTWILWSKNPAVTYPHFCPGWSLLFLWQDNAGT